MARFNRINLDGKSITETRPAGAQGARPGSAMVINSEDVFVSPAGGEAVQRLYVANTGHLQGLTADDTIPAGDSVEGEYLETGRGLAVLLAADQEVTKDTPLAVNAAGQFVAAGEGAAVVAYSQETHETSDDPELIWARGA